MSTLYIRLPSKSATDSSPGWMGLGCPYALVSNDDAIEREGIASLPDISGYIAKAQRIVLLVAASDVTLLRLQVPPLSASRLKLALPNLVEEQLVSDPADCVIVAGAASPGLRMVAVAQRGWLELVMQALLAQGAQNISAVPAQLCLPCRAGFTSAAITTTNAEAELTLRISEQEGIGLPLVIEQKESAVNEALLALNLMVPAGPVVLYVPHSELGAYQAQISTIAGLEQRVTLTADHWSNWIAGAKATDLNLATGLGAGSGMQLNWRPWRWPLALAAVALAVNIVGLNLDWWRMQREATQLRTNMIQIYKSTYPKETVVLDPVAQMRQKAAAAQTAAGRLTTDDFLALAARLGQSFGSVAQSASSAKTGVPAVATLEYRDRSLWLKLKAPADSAAEQLKAALAAQGLFVFESDAGTWKIRSTK